MAVTWHSANRISLRMPGCWSTSDVGVRGFDVRTDVTAFCAVVQRRTAEALPVRRQGRFMTTTPDELKRLDGERIGHAVHVATTKTDLAAELKRGLAFVRQERETVPKNNKRRAIKGGKRR
jgi:hypothetical protein